MNNGDFRVILSITELEPLMLPTLLKLYQLGVGRGISEQLKADKKELEIKSAKLLERK